MQPSALFSRVAAGAILVVAVWIFWIRFGDEGLFPSAVIGLGVWLLILYPRVAKRFKVRILSWSQLFGRSPAYPPRMIEEARKHPDAWVYEIDGSYGPDDEVPPAAIKGSWKVDSQGHLTGEFKPNPNFRPSDGGRSIPS